MGTKITIEPNTPLAMSILGRPLESSRRTDEFGSIQWKIGSDLYVRQGVSLFFVSSGVRTMKSTLHIGSWYLGPKRL